MFVPPQNLTVFDNCWGEWRCINESWKGISVYQCASSSVYLWQARTPCQLCLSRKQENNTMTTSGGDGTSYANWMNFAGGWELRWCANCGFAQFTGFCSAMCRKSRPHDTVERATTPRRDENCRFNLCETHGDGRWFDKRDYTNVLKTRLYWLTWVVLC